MDLNLFTSHIGFIAVFFGLGVIVGYRLKEKLQKIVLKFLEAKKS